MSWEGYTQNFCTKGHYFGGDAGFDCEPTHCECGAKIALQIIVDDTNVDSVGVIPRDKLKTLLISEAVTEVCNLGHTHVVQPEVYRIPTKEDLKVLQHYYDQETDTFIPLYKEGGAEEA